MAANASALLVANLAAAVVVGRRWLRRPHPVDLLSRGSRAASTSDWPRCAPCFAGIARLKAITPPSLPCAESRSLGRRFPTSQTPAAERLQASAEAARVLSSDRRNRSKPAARGGPIPASHTAASRLLRQRRLGCCLSMEGEARRSRR